MKAKIVEIFSSLQGEGIKLGERQIFVRFAGCNLQCGYCDTPASRESVHAREMSIAEVMLKIDLLNKQRPHKTVSLTGGEPLLQGEFLKSLLPLLKKSGYEIYIETNGTKPEILRQILSMVDTVSMDIKCSSDCGHDLWDIHREFLEVGLGKIFVKIVLTSQTTNDEIIQAVHLVADIDKHIPFVLQPVTVMPGIEAASRDNILSWRQIAMKQLSDTRLISQKHPEWKIH
ncbi:MAG: 7-carboxy-7-deazaguanine synthase QueE [bacterium]